MTSLTSLRDESSIPQLVNMESKSLVNACVRSYSTVHFNKYKRTRLRTTVPLVSYIRNSLRFWYYASLSTCCQTLEKKLGSPGKFGRKLGSNF